MGPRRIFVTAFVLVLYGNGAAFVESFVNYSSWHLIGSREFVAYHQFIGPRVLTFLVAPVLLGTVFPVLMLWARPAAIPLWAVWAAIAAQMIVWVSTATIQVPIQLQLGAHGLSLELIERLIKTNFWLRRVPYAACAGLFLWMAAKAIDAGGETRAVRRVPPDPLNRGSVMVLAAALLLASACASTPRLKSWEIVERVESRIRVGMFKREVLALLGEPSLRRWRVYGGAEREPLDAEHKLYSECWYWGRDATVCFAEAPPYEVAYKHATSDSTPR